MKQMYLEEVDLKLVMETLYLQAINLTGSCFIMNPVSCRKQMQKYMNIYRELNIQTGVHAFDNTIEEIIETFSKFGVDIK